MSKTNFFDMRLSFDVILSCIPIGYDAMGYEMSKPHLRAELEADLKK